MEWTAVFSLLGVVIGAGSKVVFDLITERGRNARADSVWRRDRLVNAASEFLEATVPLADATNELGFTIINYMATRQSSPSEAATFGPEIDARHDARNPLILAADQRLQLLRVFAPDEVVDRARLLVTACRVAPSEKRLADNSMPDLEQLTQKFVAAVQTHTDSKVGG